MNEEGITDDEYERARTVWSAFDCKTFQNYQDLYLKTDIVLLADVFENVRDLSMKTYGLATHQCRFGINYRSRNVAIFRKRNARGYRLSATVM
jgi:hypothetical protein